MSETNQALGTPVDLVLGAWQPIATAPCDGTRVLTYREGWQEHTTVAWFNSTGCGAACWVPVWGSQCPPPTHWTPLPAPPQSA
jgi:hypothetical protein